MFFNNRHLNDNELAFIANQVNNSRKLLFRLFILIAAIITMTAIFVYSKIETNHVIINIMFGVLIVLLYALNWFFKGYKQHQINPKVHKASGVYKRIYESQGKNGSYHDTINGIKVKIPWYWRRYLRSQKQSLDYEYIIRHGAVAVNDGASRYVVSANNVLSLDYEIDNGLKKVKPVSLLNMVSIISLIPVIIILFTGNTIADGLKFNELTKHANQPIILNGSEDLATITASNYITINKAWVYQYKRAADVYGENHIISTTERHRIYHHPSSNYSFKYFLPAKALSKPNKDAFKKRLKQSARANKAVFKNTPDSIWEKTINKQFENQLSDYNDRVIGLKKVEAVLEELKPKTTILKLSENCFNPIENPKNAIKKSLENQLMVHGFYNPKQNTIISVEEQAHKREYIKNAFTLGCISLVILLIALISFIKIILNSLLKLKLVKMQIQVHTGFTRLKR